MSNSFKPRSLVLDAIIWISVGIIRKEKGEADYLPFIVLQAHKLGPLFALCPRTRSPAKERLLFVSKNFYSKT